MTSGYVCACREGFSGEWDGAGPGGHVEPGHRPAVENPGGSWTRWCGFPGPRLRAGLFLHARQNLAIAPG